MDPSEETRRRSGRLDQIEQATRFPRMPSQSPPDSPTSSLTLEDSDISPHNQLFGDPHHLGGLMDHTGSSSKGGVNPPPGFPSADTPPPPIHPSKPVFNFGNMVLGSHPPSSLNSSDDNNTSVSSSGASSVASSSSTLTSSLTGSSSSSSEGGDRGGASSADRAANGSSQPLAAASYSTNVQKEVARQVEQQERQAHTSSALFNSLSNLSEMNGMSPVPFLFQTAAAASSSGSGFAATSQNFSSHEAYEKYCRARTRKQQRAKKFDKNVVTQCKAEDVEGYEGEKPIDDLLESLGESTTDEKTKGSGTKNKRGNKEKKDKKRREKVQPEEDHVTTTAKEAAESGGEEAMVTAAANILARKEEKRKGKGSAAAAIGGGSGGTAGNSGGRIDIQEFGQQNVYLVATDEDKNLVQSEGLAASSESLNFVPVTGKKKGKKAKDDQDKRQDYARKSKEDTGRPPPAGGGGRDGKPQPPVPPGVGRESSKPAAAGDSRRTSNYSLRSREVQIVGDTDGVGSTSGSSKKVDGPTPQPPLNNSPEEFPALNASQDFPALPTVGPTDEPHIHSAWVRKPSSSGSSATGSQAVISTTTTTNNTLQQQQPSSCDKPIVKKSSGEQPPTNNTDSGKAVANSSCEEDRNPAAVHAAAEQVIQKAAQFDISKGQNVAAAASTAVNDNVIEAANDNDNSKAVVKSEAAKQKTIAGADNVNNNRNKKSARNNEASAATTTNATTTITSPELKNAAADYSAADNGNINCDNKSVVSDDTAVVKDSNTEAVISFGDPATALAGEHTAASDLGHDDASNPLLSDDPVVKDDSQKDNIAVSNQGINDGDFVGDENGQDNSKFEFDTRLNCDGEVEEDGEISFGFDVNYQLLDTASTNNAPEVSFIQHETEKETPVINDLTPVTAADNGSGQMDGPVNEEDGLEDSATSIASVDKAIISYTTAQGVIVGGGYRYMAPPPFATNYMPVLSQMGGADSPAGNGGGARGDVEGCPEDDDSCQPEPKEVVSPESGICSPLSWQGEGDGVGEEGGVVGANTASSPPLQPGSYPRRPEEGRDIISKLNKYILRGTSRSPSPEHSIRSGSAGSYTPNNNNSRGGGGGGAGLTHSNSGGANDSGINNSLRLTGGGSVGMGDEEGLGESASPPSRNHCEIVSFLQNNWDEFSKDKKAKFYDEDQKQRR